MKDSLLFVGVDRQMDDVEGKVEKDKEVSAAHSELKEVFQAIEPLIGDLAAKLEEAINGASYNEIRAAYEIGLADGLILTEDIKKLIKNRGTTNGN